MSDVVVLNDADCPTRILSNKNQSHVRGTDSLFGPNNPDKNLRKCPSLAHGVDHGADSKSEPSRSISRYVEIQGNGRSSSNGTQINTVDSFFDQNGSGTDSKCFNSRGNPTRFESLQDRSKCRKNQCNGGSLLEQNPVSGIDVLSEQNGSDASSKTCGRRMFSSSPQMDFVQEQKSHKANFQEHFADHYLGFGIGFEPSPDRFRSSDDKDGEKPLLNFDKEEWLSEPHPRPVPEKLWPDEEPPEPKRSRISSPTVNLTRTEKSSSSGLSGLPVKKTVRAVDFVMPRSSVYSTQVVSLMQSDEGLHVITEETVAHTIFDGLPGSDIHKSRNGAQNRAICYHNTEEHENRTKCASLSESWSTTCVPDRSDKRPDDRIQEIILSPSRDTGTVVCQAPSKTFCSVGGTDRADIAGGWKPLCGQTVVRKPRRPPENSTETNSVGIRKPAKPVSDSLWTTFDGAVRKSGTCPQPVPGQGRFGVAKKGQEPVLSQPATLPTVRAGAGDKMGNSMSDLLELPLVNTAAPRNRDGVANILGSRCDMAKSSSSSKRLESGSVRNTADRSNNDYQCTGSKSTNSVKNFVELPSRNFSRPSRELELEGSKGSRPFRASSFGDRIESATVQNAERKRNAVDGYSDNVELPSETSNTSFNRFNAVGFSDSRPGLVTKNSFGERFKSVGVQNMEKKNISNDGKDEYQGAVSKWHKFQETDPTDQRRQPHLQSTGSSLARTTNQSSYQVASSDLTRTQPVSSSPVQLISPDQIQHHEPLTQSSDLVGAKTTGSSLVRTTGHGSFQYEVQHSLPSRKPEVACVTPQVRQPLRALRLDHDTSEISPAEDGMHYVTLSYLVHFVAVILKYRKEEEHQAMIGTLCHQGPIVCY